MGGWQGPRRSRDYPTHVERQARVVTALGAFLKDGTTGNLERLRAAYDDLHGAP